MKKHPEKSPLLSSELDNPRQSIYLHYLLIGLCIFFLLQDLLAEIFRNIPVLSRLIKFVDELSSLTLFGLVMLTRMSRGRLLPALNINWPLLFFLILLLIPSIIYEIKPFIVISQLIIYIKAFLYLYVFASMKMNKTVFNKYLTIFFRVAVIFFILGIADFIAPAAFRRLTGNGTYIEYNFGLPAVKSLFIHPYLMGWFMSFMALFSFAYFLIRKKSSLLLACLLFCIGCFMALRMKSIAGLGISLFLGFLIAPVNPKLKLSLGLALSPFVILGLLITAPVINNLFQTKLQFYFNSENSMEVARNILTYKSFQIAGDYFPLGAGLGRYGSHLSVLYYSPLYFTYGLSRIYGMSRAHSSFITDTFWPMIIGESGYIGLGLYILIFFLIMKFIYREIKLEPDADCKAFQLGTLLVTVEGLIETIAAPIFTSPPAGFFILSAVGMSYALHRMRVLKQRAGLPGSDALV